jgi:hypothetical protein
MYKFIKNMGVMNMKSEKEIKEMLEKQSQRDSKKEQITNEKEINAIIQTLEWILEIK